MKIDGIEQQTPEWLQMRVGMVTASRVADVLAVLKRKEGESAARRGYKYDLVTEALTGRAVDTYVSPAMEWGIENEALAAAAYEMANDCELDAGGFWIHDKIMRFGASPDRLLGSDGLIEIKCPTTATHLDYLLEGTIPLQYAPQMLAEMACTGRQFCDFVSFDPRLPKRLQLFIRRMERDDGLIGAMEAAVEQFLKEVDEILARLGERKEQPDAESVSRSSAGNEGQTVNIDRGREQPVLSSEES